MTTLEDTARYYMWLRISQTAYSPGISPNRTQGKRARQAWAKACGYASPFQLQPTEQDYQKARDYPLNHSDVNIDNMTATQVNALLDHMIYPPVVSTSCTAQCAGYAAYPCMPKRPSVKAKEEKENDMAYGCNENLETTQRNHLKRRADTVNYEKSNEISAKYLPEVKTPLTRDDITRKLLAGEFELRQRYFDGNGDLNDFRSAVEAIKWTDPSLKQDRAGFDAATVTLDKAYTAAKDAVLVLPLADGLKALQDFEAMTF